MTAGTVWGLVGVGAVVIGLYVLLLIFTTNRDQWPR